MTNKPACAPCRQQRKRCMKECILAPYYPMIRDQEYEAVHKVFGYKNLKKMLKNLDTQGRKKAIESFDWEAKMWNHDPINGPLGAYIEAEKKIVELQNLLQQQQTVVPFSQSKFMGLTQDSCSFSNDVVPVSNYSTLSSFEANKNVVHNPYFEYPYGENRCAWQNEEPNLLNSVVAGANVWQPSQSNYLQSLASSSGTNVTVEQHSQYYDHMGMQGEGQQHSKYYSFRQH